MECLRKKIYFVIKRICRLLVKDEQIKTLLQFIKFGLVGVSNTVISYFLYIVFTIRGFHYMAANFCAFAVSVLNSFFWNNRYVFKTKTGEKRHWLPVLAKTYVAYGITGLVLNSVLLYIEVDLFEMNELLAPIINLVITIPFNFIINKFWAYKESNGE